MAETRLVSPLEAISHAGFFILRTQLLPMVELTKWSAGLNAHKLWESEANSEALRAAWQSDVDLLRIRLRDILERPEIARALFMASPSLRIGVDYWQTDHGQAKTGLQAVRVLVRYFAGMCGRSTPFALFSGSIGKIHDNGDQRTTLSLASLRNRY